MHEVHPHRGTAPLAHARSPCNSRTDAGTESAESHPHPLQQNQRPATDHQTRHQDSTAHGTSPAGPDFGLPRLRPPVSPPSARVSQVAGSSSSNAPYTE